MRKSAFAALLLAMMLTVCPTAFAARSEPVSVTGVSDLLGGQVGGTLVPDAAGNIHLRKAEYQGSFALEGENIHVVGTQLIVLNGVLDATLSGPVAGSLTVTVDVSGNPVTVWQGTVHGRVIGLIFTGQAVAHGVGRYAGQLPK